MQGRQHPVAIYHTAAPQPDFVDAAMRVVFQIHADQPTGDILIFLPGQEDIESLDKAIRLYANRLPQDTPGVLLSSLYYLSLLISEHLDINVSAVRLATTVTATANICPCSERYTESDSCHEHCRN